MATGIFSNTLEDLKHQADKFGLEGKDRIKFLNEKWQKMQDAKLEKECFEREEKQLKKKKRNRRKIIGKRDYKKRFEGELEAKLQSEKLVAQLELKRLKLERARVECENVEA